VLACLGVATAVTLVPRAIDGYAALEWTRYHAGRMAGARRSAAEAGRVGRWASRAVDRLAPSPWAAEAAELARGVARDADPPRAARAALTPVVATLELVCRSRLRGFGLGPALEEARRQQRALAEGPR
jgi:hypothetical protein